MPQQQEARPRARSAFAAGFLSLVFPGLGHAYARAWRRAVLFAAPPLLLLALAAGTYLSFGRDDALGMIANPPVLVGILVGNVVAYAYRIVAAVDAWRVVAFVNRYEQRESPGARLPGLAMLSIAGLIATCLVMGGVHAAVGFYDSQALSLITAVTTPDDQDFPTPDPSQDVTPAPAATIPGFTPSADPSETPAPAATWDGTSRLNMLLIGSDKRPQERTWNTDTLIVLSIDPVSRKVALFSLPRDIVGVPLPPGPARNALGATWNNKINSLFTYARGHKDLFPGGGYQALKDTLGYLYGIRIPYFVEVDFNGFKTVVDALGGVTINVQKPVIDDYYPGDNGLLRVYIPTGVQHMTGAEALIYARSRHGSADYDRGARQQRVLLSLRQQADLSTIARPEVLSALVKAVGKAVKTDFPIGRLGAALELAQRIDISNVRSYVFGPKGGYATDLWPASSNVVINTPNVRRAVRSAFTFDPAAQQAHDDIANEGANVWVLDGARSGAAGDVARYLEFLGFEASAPNQHATGKAPSNTVVTVYNGAEASLPKTIAALQDIFGVTVKLATDPKVKADVVITTGQRTPRLVEPEVGN